MRKFEAPAGEKCADAPDNGKTNQKNWNKRANSGRACTWKASEVLILIQLPIGH
jgi:hypothetical protein